MSSTIHNASALNALVEQPGAQFNQTRQGFDTGRRTFKCWASVAANLLPLRGSPDATYVEMKVDTATITNERAELATIEVNYLGTLIQGQRKPDEFTYTVNYDPSTASVTYNSTTIDVAIYHPQVTHIYTTETLPTSKVGQFRDPDKFADLVMEETVQYPTINAVLTWAVALKGWRIQGRNIRDNGTIYEVTDTYFYEFVGSPTLTTT